MKLFIRKPVCAFVGVAVSIVTLTGCADKVTPSPINSSSTKTTTKVKPIVFSKSAPKNPPVEKLFTLPGSTNGNIQFPFDISPDGVALMASSPIVDPDADLLISQVSISLLDLETRKSTPVATNKHVTPYQMNNGDISKDYVVWGETPSISMTEQPWVLYGYSRTEKKVYELTKSPKMDDGSDALTVPNGFYPVILKDKAVWSQIRGTREKPAVDVWICKITDCKPSVLIKNAESPIVVGDTIGASIINDLNNRSKTNQIVFVDETGKTQRTLELTNPNKTKFPGAWVEATLGGSLFISYSGGGNNRGVLVKTNNKNIPIKITDGTANFFETGNNFIVASESTGTVGNSGWLIDKTGAVYQIGNSPGFYSLNAGGDYLTWQQKIPGQPFADTIFAKIK